MGEIEPLAPKKPSLFRNYISFVGAAIVIASLASVILLFFIEITSSVENPYVGILTYIIFPSILMFGLFVVALGMILERRRRRHTAPDVVTAYPKLDLNDPHARRAFLAFLVVTFFFISASAFGSYRAFEFTESVEFCGQTCHKVMKPEFVAYQAGAYQLYSVAFNKYSRPISTPVHNLRPAPETCEQCHWPEKFFGAQLKVFNRYGYDEQNSLRQRRMLINVGGGSPTSGLVTGIHWHMNIANEITYVSTDDHRQVIPWVQVKDRSGNVTQYYDRARPLSAEQIAAAGKRRMDCVDCHNRPAHVYLPPDVAVDQAFVAGRLDPSIPYLKRKAVEVLSGRYDTTPQALSSIDKDLNEFYQANYKDLYLQKQAAVKVAVTEIQRIFQTYFFPEMKTDWQTHPNNIGHLYSSGCFRCHDG